MKEIRRLDKSNQQDFIDFNRIIRQNIQNPSWFMPFSEENMTHTFDEGNTLVVYGVFVDECLVPCRYTTGVFNFGYAQKLNIVKNHTRSPLFKNIVRI